MSVSKKKLRTASDVISRLRWSDDNNNAADDNDDDNDTTAGANRPPFSLIMMGYLDRIEGPMEKAVKDYVSASSGGDIPEHRIIYFRRAETDNYSSSSHNNISSSIIISEQQILWDRVGRVDRIFGSGDGPDAPVAPETVAAVKAAIQNMDRIE